MGACVFCGVMQAHRFHICYLSALLRVCLSRSDGIADYVYDIILHVINYSAAAEISTRSRLIDGRVFLAV